MHPLNPYKIPPDFRELAKVYAPLEPCIIPSGSGFSIDFKNEISQRRLTEALLYRDFDISLDLPINRLCPPVSSTQMHYDFWLNYVLWIQDLVHASQPNENRPVHGMDIGTGASAIYPLLSCRLNSHWSFIATDVDEISLNSARSIVQKNKLCQKIVIFETRPEALIFAPLHTNPSLRVDFTMCNPPFYSSHEDVTASAGAKDFEPNAVCTGADIEMITPGGESAFVLRMVEESRVLRDRCQWYTSMLGKMSSLTEVISALRGNAIENYGITEFVQGSTKRWAVVWSFNDFRLPDTAARIPNPQLQTLMPPRNNLRQPFDFPRGDAEHLTKALHAVLVSIDGARVEPTTIANNSDPTIFTIYASGNTWSRSARRKKQTLEDLVAVQLSAPQLVCRLQWIFPETSESGETRTFLECQWIQGKDRSLFEGFSSHVSRKVAAVMQA
ncbi:S-adenosyl-L-methionine dependent methyltransferase [Mycena crocata]|nr:S-adenosyl-L-methionine dependent methyltransferase [Mycena crocata]